MLDYKLDTRTGCRAGGTEKKPRRNRRLGSQQTALVNGECSLPVLLGGKGFLSASVSHEMWLHELVVSRWGSSPSAKYGDGELGGRKHDPGLIVEEGTVQVSVLCLVSPASRESK
jgi:hypothetical protein